MRAIAFAADGGRVVTGSEDGTARLWTSRGRALTRADGADLVLDHRPSRVTSVGFSPRGGANRDRFGRQDREDLEGRWQGGATGAAGASVSGHGGGLLPFR
ncbi:MAG: hypothetical protein ACK41W_12040 [Cyanobacteriota bacterium]